MRPHHDSARPVAVFSPPGGGAFLWQARDCALHKRADNDPRSSERFDAQMVIYLYTFIDGNNVKDSYTTLDGVHAVERAKSLGLGLIENKFTMDDSELVEDYRDHGDDEEESDA